MKRNKPDDAETAEHRAEAKRLAALPTDDQRQIIAMHRADASNRKVPKADRDFAARRADALERLLKLRKTR
jgi:hypothetical protein